ncbi:MAG: hypothetical protein AAGF93_19555 [Cyanobacteria bacterium P01_H01_bin.105]
MLARALDPERIESVKAGIVAALVGISVSAVFVGVDSFLAGSGPLTQAVVMLQAIRRIVVGAVCCFLFGVTYRYIIRQDPNPHLRSGAVGAFALTRSLSQLETIELSGLASVVPLSIAIIESFGLFLIVRLVLDLGLKQQWLKPFTGITDSKP